MIYSILAYGLSLFSALTLWALVGVLLKFLILALVGAVVGKQKLLLNIFKFLPPTDFVAGALHGALAFWFGTCLLYWFGCPIDYFLAIFLTAGFLIVDIPRIQSSSKKVQVSQNSDLTALMGGNPNGMGDMLKNMMDNNPQAQQFKENMRNSKIIVLIGKVLGVSLAMLNLVYG